MEKSQNKIPLVRFPGFKDGWEQSQLGNLIYKTDKKNKDNLNLPVYSINNIDGFLPQAEQFEGRNSNDKGFDISIYKIINKRTFAYNPARINVGSIGYSYELDNILVSSLYVCFNTKELLDDIFFLQFLKTYDFNTSILRFEEGGVRKYLFFDNISKIKITTPTLPEQTRIANFFTVLDEKINQLQDKKALLEEYKKGVMQKIFSQKIRFKDDDGEEFADWEGVLYGSIFSFYSTNSLSRDNLNYENGKVKNIHYGDIHTKFDLLFNIQDEVTPFINETVNISKIQKENYCQVGDLVIADASEDYSDIGKAIEIINLNGEKVLAGLHTILARSKNGKMASGFTGYLMKSQKIRKQIMIIAQGTKVLGLSSKQLAKIEIRLPSVSEQTKIANFLSKIDDKIHTISEQIEQTKEYKKGLLQKMFCV